MQKLVLFSGETLARKSGCGTALSAVLLLCVPGGVAKSQSLAVAHENRQADTCSLLGIASDRPATAEDLLRAYNAHVGLVHTLRGSLILHIRNTDEADGQTSEAKPMPATLMFRSPASLRFTGTAPFSGRRTFDLASDGHEFEMLVPDRKAMRFIVGAADTPELSVTAGNEIRPQVIVEAIRGMRASSPDSAAPKLMRSGTAESIRVVLTTLTSQSVPAVLTFDARTGTLASLAAAGPEENSTTRVDYDDWHLVPDVRTTGGAVCFPTRIYITQSKQSRQIELKFVSTEANGPILPTQFRFTPPMQVAVTRISASNGRTESKP